MNQQELALQVLNLTYRHDLKPEDIIKRAKALLDFINGTDHKQACDDVQPKKPVLKK